MLFFMYLKGQKTLNTSITCNYQCALIGEGLFSRLSWPNRGFCQAVIIFCQSLSLCYKHFLHKCLSAPSLSLSLCRFSFPLCWQRLGASHRSTASMCTLQCLQLIWCPLTVERTNGAHTFSLDRPPQLKVSKQEWELFSMFRSLLKSFLHSSSRSY